MSTEEKKKAIIDGRLYNGLALLYRKHKSVNTAGKKCAQFYAKS